VVRDDVTSRISSDPTAWSSDQKVLGVLAVARAPLSNSELAAIVGSPPSNVAETVERWKPYLVLRPPDPGIELVDPSFQEFLLSDSTWGVCADEAHQAIVRFMVKDAIGRLRPDVRGRGLEQIIPHIVGGLITARDRPHRLWFAEKATELLGDTELLVAAGTPGEWSTLVNALSIGARELASLSQVPGIADGVVRSVAHIEAKLGEQSPDTSDPTSTVGAVFETVDSIVTHAYAEAYGSIRTTMPSGRVRTELMTMLVDEVGQLAEVGVFHEAAAGALMNGSEGERVIALAVLKTQPDRSLFHAICATIASSSSAFEQYQALEVIDQMLPVLAADERTVLLHVLDAERRDVRGLGVMDDPTRRNRIIAIMLRLLDEEPRTAW
jgi:hypothetical protein